MYEPKMYETTATPSPTPLSPSVKSSKRPTIAPNSPQTVKTAHNAFINKINNTQIPQKRNTSHYLATEMGLVKGTKKARRNRKKSPILSLDNLSSLETNLEYEHRKVNSIADETEDTRGNSPVRKRRMKRKPELVDSEINVLRTKEKRPTEMFPPKRHLPVIQENMSETNEVLIKSSKNKRRKLNRSSLSTTARTEVSKVSTSKVKRISPNAKQASATPAEQNDPAEQYPVLKNQELVKRFLQVDFTNNQKGRIRQVIKDILRGTSTTILPEVINNKIQSILKSSENLTDTDLRKIRVLYNMLKKATEDLKQKKLTENALADENLFKKEEKEDKKGKEDKAKDKEDKPKKKKDISLSTPGVKRYVVFVGNLPLKVTREQILNHFADIREYIKDVRIPQLSEDKKSSYAYVELDNAPVYEMALSKHHSMMGSKRINVLYTKPHKNSKISNTLAKAKSAKLMAMAKKGQLIGSVPLQKKRSHRRAKAKAFQRAQEQGIDLNSTALK